MTVGNYLREAREAAGYSVDDISTRTRIRASVIRDLESEKFESSGGNAYARGHIRTIGKIINADIDRLVSAFDETTAQSQRPMIELLEENSATVLRNRKNVNVKVSPKFIGIAASVIAGVAIIIPASLAISSSLTHKSGSAKISSNVTATSNSAATSTNTTPTPVAPTEHGVVVAASHGTSWLSVTDSKGSQLFAGILSNGSSQTFDPTNGLSITLGNAGAISISVNGKDQGSMGASGEVKSLTFAPAQTNG